MQIDPSYRRSLWGSVILHIVIIIAMLVELSSKRPVMHQESQQIAGQKTPVSHQNIPESEIVKAVSVDNQDVIREMNRIKAAQAQARQTELNRQRALQQEAARAKQARLQEQQKLQQLKQEAEKLAIARKKQAEEEQKHLKQLAIEKEKKAKELEALKQQQAELEAKRKKEDQRLALLKKQQDDRKLKAEAEAKRKKIADEKEKALQEKARLEKQEAQRKEQAMQQARDNAEQQAKMAGEVDKYKAMILDAIGRQWILPDNADHRLSSVFHIRLAPDGSVLEVSLVRSSGDPILDRSAQTAIYKASPLPVPRDTLVFNMFRDINLTVRPENVRG